MNETKLLWNIKTPLPAHCLFHFWTATSDHRRNRKNTKELREKQGQTSILLQASCRSPQSALRAQCHLENPKFSWFCTEVTGYNWISRFWIAVCKLCCVTSLAFTDDLITYCDILYTESNLVHNYYICCKPLLGRERGMEERAGGRGQGKKGLEFPKGVGIF